MRTRPTLMNAAGIFVLTAVMFAAAIVIANGLAIPDPARRFVPSASRDLPDDAAPDHDEDPTDLELTGRDDGDMADESVPVVTAVATPFDDDPIADAGPDPADEGSAGVASSGIAAADPDPDVSTPATRRRDTKATASRPADESAPTGDDDGQTTATAKGDRDGTATSRPDAAPGTEGGDDSDAASSSEDASSPPPSEPAPSRDRDRDWDWDWDDDSSRYWYWPRRDRDGRRRTSESSTRWWSDGFRAHSYHP